MQLSRCKSVFGCGLAESVLTDAVGWVDVYRNPYAGMGWFTFSQRSEEFLNRLCVWPLNDYLQSMTALNPAYGRFQWPADFRFQFLTRNDIVNLLPQLIGSG